MSSSLSALSRQLSNTTSSQPQSSSSHTTPPLNPSSSLLLQQQTQQQQQHNNVNNYIHQPYHHHQLESIPNQIGYAILQQSNNDGNGSTMIQQPTGKLSIHDVNILYKMLIEIGDLLYTSFEKKQQQKKKKNGSDGSDGIGVGVGGSTSEVLKRFNVEMNSISYSVCVTVDGYIYIVMKESKKFQSTTL